MKRCSKAASGWLALLCLVGCLCGSYASQEHDKCFLLRLKDRNVDGVAAAVQEIASISSSKAGKWLSAEDVALLSGRSQEEVNQLKTFVESHSGRLEQVSPTRDMALACFPPNALVLQGPQSPLPAAISPKPPAANASPVAANTSQPTAANNPSPAMANNPKPANTGKVVGGTSPTPSAADKPQAVDSKTSTRTEVSKPKVEDSKSSTPTGADKPKVVSGTSPAPAETEKPKAVDNKSATPAEVNKPKVVDSNTPTSSTAADKPKVVSRSTPTPAEATKPKVVDSKGSTPADVNKPKVEDSKSSTPAAAEKPKVVSGTSPTPAEADKPKAVGGNSTAPAEATTPQVVSGTSPTPAEADKAKVVDSKSSTPAAANEPKAVSGNTPTLAKDDKPKAVDSKSSPSAGADKLKVVSGTSPTPAAAEADKPKAVDSKTSTPTATDKPKAVDSTAPTPAAPDKPKVADSKSSTPATADKPKVVVGTTPTPAAAEADNAKAVDSKTSTPTAANTPKAVSGNTSTPAAANNTTAVIGNSSAPAVAPKGRVLLASDLNLMGVNNSRLVEATWKAVQAHAPPGMATGPAAVSAAEQLAAALPAALADITEVVLPVSRLQPTLPTTTTTSSKYASGPIIRTAGPGVPVQGRSTAAQGAAAAGGAGSYTVQATSTISGIQVSTPYGVPLPQPVGYFAGYTDPATQVSYAIPQFTTDTLLYALGASDAAAILKSINEVPTLFMLPCSVVTDENAAIQGMVFATTAHEAECAGQLNITWHETYADGKYAPVPRQSLTYTPQPIGTCGDAVGRSRGRLPNDTCAQIAAQYIEFTNVPSDISDDTVLYWYGPVTAGVTTYVGLKDLDVSLTLSSSVQEPFRSFGRVHYASYGSTILAGANTPAEWRAIYNVPPYANSAGAGLLVRPAGYAPQADYNYCPYDLAAASRAFNSLMPTVASVTSAPLFPANNPAAVYAAESGGKGAAALDIQMIAEYGAGSGAKFGFVASSSNNELNVLGDLSNFLGYMGLRPLPDVLSLSWGSAQPAPTGADQIKELLASDTILAKMAAMGVTVVAASGDYGNYGTARATCDAPFAPQAPAGSPWVTSVGAVQQARKAPNAAPELVGAVSPLGTPLTSAGGFSWVAQAQTPTWQDQHVKRYIQSQQSLPSWPFAPNNAAATGASNSLSCGAADTSSCFYGRGFPDLALSGVLMPVQLAGVPQAISGTSASAPAFAGLVMHLNAAVRANPGLEHSKLGFLNPFLYWAAEHYPKAFTDITVGGTGFAPNGTPCTASFNAAPGWDAFTGLGVPNIGELSKAALEWVSRQEGLWYNNQHYGTKERRDAAERKDAAERDAGPGPNRQVNSGPDYRASRGHDRRVDHGSEQQDGWEGPDRSPHSPHRRRRDYTGPNARSEQDPDRRSGNSFDSLELDLGGHSNEQQQLWQDFEWYSQHGGHHGDGSSRGPYREDDRENSEEGDHDELFDSSRHGGYKRRAPDADEDDHDREGRHPHGRRGHDDDYEPRDPENEKYTRQRRHGYDSDNDDKHAHGGYSDTGSDSDGGEDRDRRYPDTAKHDRQQRRYTRDDAEAPTDDAHESYDARDRSDNNDSRRHRHGYEVDYEHREDRRGRRGDAYEGSGIEADEYTVRSGAMLDRRQAGEMTLQGSGNTWYPEHPDSTHHSRQRDHDHDEYVSREEPKGTGRRDEGRDGHAGYGYTRDEGRSGYPAGNAHGDRRQRAEDSQQ